jgi:hypothetical protein
LNEEENASEEEDNATYLIAIAEWKTIIVK